MPGRILTRRVTPLLLAAGLFTPSLALAQGIAPGRTPLRTSLDEIRVVRESYAEAYNRKDAAAVASVYADDAVVVFPDGSMLSGSEAIANQMKAEAPNWPHLVIKSDTVRVYGNTAVDIGTATMHPKEGAEEVSRYMVMTRRGMHGWKVTHVTLVPISKK